MGSILLVFLLLRCTFLANLLTLSLLWGLVADLTHLDGWLAHNLADLPHVGVELAQCVLVTLQQLVELFVDLVLGVQVEIVVFEQLHILLTTPKRPGRRLRPDQPMSNCLALFLLRRLLLRTKDTHLGGIIGHLVLQLCDLLLQLIVLDQQLAVSFPECDVLLGDLLDLVVVRELLETVEVLAQVLILFLDDVHVLDLLLHDLIFFVDGIVVFLVQLLFQLGVLEKLLCISLLEPLDFLVLPISFVVLIYFASSRELHLL